jgi:hypothetical protein
MVSDTVLVGVLTFVGTGLATTTGLWQWQRAQAREARASFHTQRVQAVSEVWEALMDLEESLRMSIMSFGDPTSTPPPTGTGELTQVNLLLLRRSPFLLSDEQEWAQAFVQHVTEIDTLLRADMAHGKPREEWWVTSAQQPNSSSIVTQAADQLRMIRSRLGERYAAVVRGDSK